MKPFRASFTDWGCLLPTDHQPEMPPANGEHNWIQQVKKVRGTLHEVLIVVAKWVKTDCRELLDWGCFFLPPKHQPAMIPTNGGHSRIQQVE